MRYTFEYVKNYAKSKGYHIEKERRYDSEYTLWRIKQDGVTTYCKTLQECLDELN